MPRAARNSKPTHGEKVIGEATDRLLLAAKKKMLRDHGRIDYDKLAHQGFSVEMIELLKSL
jgi:hypothetical protein